MVLGGRRAATTFVARGQTRCKIERGEADVGGIYGVRSKLTVPLRVEGV